MKHTKWIALLPLILLAGTCQPAEKSTETVLPVPAPTVGQPLAEYWTCKNDLEIACNAGKCETEDSFTPMEVQVDDAGSMSVCAYSGCWEGTGTVAKSEDFVVLTGHDLAFSTAPDSEEGKEDIVIVIDRADDVAILKAGAFAHPLLCEKLKD